MTPLQVLGYAMLVVPLVVLFFLTVHLLDWKIAFTVFGGLGLFYTFVLIGSMLAAG